MSKRSAFQCAREAVQAEERLLEILMGETTEGEEVREDQERCPLEDRAEHDDSA